jgi:hypothetical protein
VRVSRVNDAQTAQRRDQVAELWARGANYTKIAVTLGIDRQTAKRDVALIAQQAVADIDIPRELTRCLLSARAVELDRWAKGLPLQALAATRVVIAVLGQMQSLEVEARLKAIEARLDALQGVQPWMAPRVRAAQENGTGRG